MRESTPWPWDDDKEIKDDGEDDNENNEEGEMDNPTELQCNYKG